ncbi:MAG: hypothetical protein IPL21_11365 [Saprospirales bacterium]|nr:hypothetical protein [Saprospirales bacterium]
MVRILQIILVIFHFYTVGFAQNPRVKINYAAYQGMMTSVGNAGFGTSLLCENNGLEIQYTFF